MKIHLLSPRVPVILTEVLLTLFLVPNAEEVASRAEAGLTERLHQRLNKSVDNEKTVEIPLGQFSITSQHSESSTSLRIDLKVFGTVLEEDRSAVEKTLARVENRLRDSVIIEIRNSNVSDLTDPGLALIKRRILEKSNQILGDATIQSIIIPEFSFVEQ
jgi:flagellar FliL protein